MRTARTLDALFPRQEGAVYWFLSASGETRLTCSGLAARIPRSAVNPTTTFHCFSATKPVTALAILQLAEQDRISLDAPLSTYLADLPYRNGATLRQVLSHQAGLPNPLPLSWVHADADHSSFDARAFLDRVLRDHPRCGPAGRKVRYSNIGFLLLGRILEQVLQREYTQVVRERILDPIVSKDGESYLGFDLPKAGHAVGYTRRWSGLGLFIALLPDPAELRVTEGAWIRYRPFHLNGAAYGGLKGNASGWAPLLTALVARDPRLLPARGYDAFLAPQSLTTGEPTGHALSWFTGRLARHDYLCHAGGGPGYGAEIRIYPGLGAASVLLTNTTIVSDLRLLDRLDPDWLP
jgi:D-alanyl-D-alanine carboxypeptidase